jgi:hypothetical protein
MPAPIVVMAATPAETAAAIRIADYLWRAREQGRPACGAFYGTGDPADRVAAICRRPHHHEPSSVDGVGHHTWPVDEDHIHRTGESCPVADCTWPVPS